MQKKNFQHGRDNRKVPKKFGTYAEYIYSTPPQAENEKSQIFTIFFQSQKFFNTPKNFLNFFKNFSPWKIFLKSRKFWFFRPYSLPTFTKNIFLLFFSLLRDLAIFRGFFFGPVPPEGVRSRWVKISRGYVFAGGLRFYGVTFLRGYRALRDAPFNPPAKT